MMRNRERKLARRHSLIREVRIRALVVAGGSQYILYRLETMIAPSS